MDIIVGIADMKLTKDPKATLVTHALGSCLGVCIWDPALKISGLLHYMLPDSTKSPDKAQLKPYMFGNIGIPAMFKQAYALGSTKKGLVVKLVGAAQVMDDGNLFNIGKKNYLLARKLLYKNGIMIKAEEVGGNTHRTVRINVDTGEIKVKIKGGEVLTI
jgi:chemotaxis protein CheD